MRWYDKLLLKKALKKIKEKFTKDKEQKRWENEEKRKESLIKAIIEMQEVLEITNEQGQPVTSKELKTMTVGQLTELIENILDQAQEHI